MTNDLMTFKNMTTQTIWQRMGLQDWFLKKEAKPVTATAPQLTPDKIYDYIVEKFEESVKQLSFANRVIFYHEYIIGFNPQDYEEFMVHKKGIFGFIVQEAVKKFYEILKNYRGQGKTVEPASNKWVFRFVSHPDYPQGDKSFIGKLLPGAVAQKKSENLRVTYIPRQTGIAETFDISNEFLQGFNFYSDGYYELPYRNDLVLDEAAINTNKNVLARLEAIIPDKGFTGKKIEFLMKDNEITVSGKEETKQAQNIFSIPSEWIDSPHLKIAFNNNENKFYLASFGEKTMLNEKQIQSSQNGKPHWVELPVNSRIVLNGIAGINIFKA
jgi:hypothetical protein